LGQLELGVRRLWIEFQCALEQAHRFSVIIAGYRSVSDSASAQNVVQRIGVLIGTMRFSGGDFNTQGDRDAAGDLVLQREQIGCIAVELLGPQMRVGFGVD